MAAKNESFWSKLKIKLPFVKPKVDGIQSLYSSAKSKSAEHIHRELPYRFYDEETHIFTNLNTIGFGLHLGILSGSNDEVVESINKLLASDFPEGKDWDYQVILRALSTFLLVRSQAS